MLQWKDERMMKVFSSLLFEVKVQFALVTSLNLCRQSSPHTVLRSCSIFSRRCFLGHMEAQASQMTTGMLLVLWYVMKQSSLQNTSSRPSRVFLKGYWRTRLQHAHYFRFQTQQISKNQKKKKKKKSRPHISTVAAHLAHQLWHSGFQRIQTGTAAQLLLCSEVIHRNENDVLRLLYGSEKQDGHFFMTLLTIQVNTDVLTEHFARENKNKNYTGTYFSDTF